MRFGLGFDFDYILDCLWSGICGLNLHLGICHLGVAIGALINNWGLIYAQLLGF